MKIPIGPFFCAAACTTGSDAATPLNVCVEWASTSKAVRLPLFQMCPKGMSKVRLHHIVVRAAELPCDASCPEHQVIDAPEGTFIPLEAALAAIYRDNEVDRDIREVLQELGEFVALNNSVREHVAKEGLLLPAIENAGFCMVNVLREGDEVLAEIGWHPAKSQNLFHTANCRFRVQSGDIIEDCWLKSEGEPQISNLLAEKFHKTFPGSPRALMTKACLEQVAQS